MRISSLELVEEKFVRIAIDARPAVSKHRHGIYTYAERLLCALGQAAGKEKLLLLFTSLKRSTPILPELEKNPAFEKKNIYVPDRDFKGKHTILSRIILPFLLTRWGCDIFHSLFYPYCLKCKHTTYILTVHDLIPVVLWKLDRGKYKDAFNDARVIIAVSHYTKKDIMEYFDIHPEKIKVVYEGVDSRYRVIEDAKLLTEARQRYSIERDYFLTLGGVKRKNIERLIEAFSVFKYKEDFCLVVGGSGPYTGAYSRLADDLRLSRDVRIVGYIQDEDLPYLYSGAHCFVFPSLYEGFGLPVLEAMASGTPVIASNTSSLPEIGGNSALYVDPHDVGQIAAAMERIVENAELRMKLIEDGLTRAKQFTWEKAAEKLLDIYRGVCP